MFHSLLVATLLGVFAAVELDSNPSEKKFIEACDRIGTPQQAEGIAALREMAPQHLNAANALLLIYSRGYGQEPIDYQAVEFYWNLAQKQALRQQVSNSLLNTIDVTSLPPQNGKTSLKLLVPDRQLHRYVLRDIPLRGTYPAQACYRDAMSRLGGNLAAQVLRLNSQNYSERNRTAARLGNCNAILQWNYNQSTPKFQQDDRQMYEASKAGIRLKHVPSLLYHARILHWNRIGIPVDYARSRRYLTEAQELLAPYRKIGCRHADQTLQYIQTRLERIPHPAWTLEELDQKIKTMDRGKFSLPEQEAFELLRAAKSPLFARYLAAEAVLMKNHAEGLKLL